MEFKEDMRNNDLTYHCEHLKANITKNIDIDNPSKLEINTNIVVDNLSQWESQSIIIESLNKNAHENIIGIIFNYKTNQEYQQSR